MKQIITLLFFLLATNFLAAQVIEWEQNYGGNGSDYINELIPTEDGGFLLAGGSNSTNGDVNDNYGESDFWVVKIDAIGNLEWEQNYGCGGNDVLYTAAATNDGGFILGGRIDSVGNDVTNNNGKWDFWVVKIDGMGNIQWEQNYGGSEQDILYSLATTNDGGFILGGMTRSNDGDISDDQENQDFWIVKIDAFGNIEWEQAYGESIEECYTVSQTEDGGFILGGSNHENPGIDNYGFKDFWIVKIDAIGNVEWEQNYGGSSHETCSSILQTSDGGFICGGGTQSNDIDVTNNYGNKDVWVIKIDNIGNLEWEKSYGGINYESLGVLKATSDGGFILGGNNNLLNNNDFWVIKINDVGDIEWEQTYGGSDSDFLNTLQEIDNGVFVLGGSSRSNDGNVGDNNGLSDMWLLKIREIKQTITAIPFYDENENGFLDNAEQHLYNLPIAINPTAVASIESSTDGTTIFYVDPATYTIQYDNASNNLWQVINAPESYTIEITEPIDTSFYFPMQPVTDFYIQWVDVSTSIIRCNQETNVWLTYTNNSSESTSGYVSLLANDLATFVSATPPVDSIAGDTLYWFYEDLYPTHSEQIHLIYQMPDVESIGENIIFDAQIETWEGYGNDKDLLSSELVCAYDPNDKLVTPIGIGEENYTLFEDSLFNYTIRFQNTGNDTAFNITILDTLSEYLDINTYNFIASSHDVNTKINEAERTIEFQFNDIYLPDSNVNEVGSHGFVKFNIESNPNLAENTPIENTAGIYFDLNPPIVTNTTHNLMVSEIPTNLEDINEKTYVIYPNPNTGIFNIQTPNQNIQTIKIYNTMGQLLQVESVNSLQTQVDIQVKSNGVYFVELLIDGQLSIEKIIVH